jgi:NAD(P)-dependent dehydrogenase (short-subunit alcohol dehydrogenase family)
MEHKKVAFITGANRGIGLETAKGLARKGVHVLLGSRDQAKGEIACQQLKSEGLSVDMIVFDIDHLVDHQKVADYIIKQHDGKLDILVNNAGVWLESEAGNHANFTSTLAMDILHRTFNTNFFHVVALTQTLLPLLRQSPAGRIVNLSSILGSLTLHADPASPIYASKAFAYDASKTALNAFTVHLAHELRQTNMKVNSAHPGWVKTAMGGSNAPMEVEDGAKTSVALALLPDDGPSGGFFHLNDTLPW